MTRQPVTSGRTRPLSRVFAALGLLLTSPVLALAGVLIKASSSGPVLFRARRAGLAGRPFTMLKLRTMHQRQDDESVHRITGGRDVRVFPAGRLLRRLKVDELPQLVNVVRGDMTLVGPRPEDLSIVADHYTPLMLQTLDVLPGMASPGSLAYADVLRGLPESAAESESLYIREHLPRKLALELVYVHNRSRLYDVEIVLRSVAAVVGLRRRLFRRQAWEAQQAETWFRRVLEERCPHVREAP